MSNSSDERLAGVIAAIDRANAADPNLAVGTDGGVPAELLYGRRMSETLARLSPAASEHVQIAARGQHIERWTTPRRSYPEGRAGYLKWRNDLKEMHARRVGEIMADVGYGGEDIARVQSLLRKERLKSDAETQAIEDTACLVFLEHYLGEFMQKIERDKLPGILAKTWNKMSPQGREMALGLAIAPEVSALLEQGLAQLRAGARPGAAS
ncbi:MAG: DUF4202 domain-containing protein [Proteobacteria bacterium]|nr:MAG: DUF4202 domain-containing protein [Pseudomonadota bacterium]